MFDFAALFGRKPSRAGFARLVEEQLGRMRPDLGFQFDAGSFSFRNGSGQVLNLHNIYADHCRTPRKARAQQLEHFLAGTLGTELPAALADARPHLLPVLRQLPGLDVVRIEHQGVNADGRRLEAMFAYQTLAADLGVALAYDTPFAMAQVGHEELERWGLSLPQALEIAVDNLRHMKPPQFVEAAPNLFLSSYGDYYDAARLLLPEVAHQVVTYGEPVAMAPNREHLLLASSRDGAALERMMAAAEQLLQKPRRLSATLFRLQDRQWQPWQPDHEPAATMLHNLQRDMLCVDYEEQGEAMRQAVARAGGDVFVARHGLWRAEGLPRSVSLSTLAQDVHTYLPVTDLMAIQQPGEGADNSLLVRWADFAAIAGELLQPLACLPPRFEYRGGLQEAHFERLRGVTTCLDEVARS